MVPPRASLWRIADLTLAAAVAVFAVVVHVGLYVHYPNMAGWSITLGLGLLPALLLLIPRVPAAVALALVSFPCFIGASMYCDLAPSDATWGILHAGEGWLLLLTPYSLVRAFVLIRQDHARLRAVPRPPEG